MHENVTSKFCTRVQNCDVTFYVDVCTKYKFVASIQLVKVAKGFRAVGFQFTHMEELIRWPCIVYLFQIVYTVYVMKCWRI